MKAEISGSNLGGAIFVIMYRRSRWVLLVLYITDIPEAVRMDTAQSVLTDFKLILACISSSARPEVLLMRRKI